MADPSASGHGGITRIPLTITATATGQTTDDVLVAVMASDLDALEAKAERVMNPLHTLGVTLTDANGTLYRIEHAGVWDPPEGSERVTVFYEDEEIPQGAVSLYRMVIEEESHG